MEKLRKSMENGTSKELYGNLTLWGNSHIVRIYISWMCSTMYLKKNWGVDYSWFAHHLPRPGRPWNSRGLMESPDPHCGLWFKKDIGVEKPWRIIPPNSVWLMWLVSIGKVSLGHKFGLLTPDARRKGQPIGGTVVRGSNTVHDESHRSQKQQSQRWVPAGARWNDGWGLHLHTDPYISSPNLPDQVCLNGLYIVLEVFFCVVESPIMIIWLKRSRF